MLVLHPSNVTKVQNRLHVRTKMYKKVGRHGKLEATRTNIVSNVHSDYRVRQGFDCLL